LQDIIRGEVAAITKSRRRGTTKLAAILSAQAEATATNALADRVLHHHECRDANRQRRSLRFARAALFTNRFRHLRRAVGLRQRAYFQPSARDGERAQVVCRHEQQDVVIFESGRKIRRL